MPDISWADIGQLAIVGAVVSLVVQYVKNSAYISRTVTILMVIVFSMVAAGIWYFVKDNVHFLATATQILLIANTVYGFVISYFEPKTQSPV